MPKVSVLMPVFNAAATLPAACKSILDQTLLDFEFVIVDDGSTDGSRDFLEVLASRDQRVRLLLRAHEGLVSALNAGLAQVRAPLFARMDADDLSYPQRLARQLEFMDAHPQLAAAGCLVDFTESQATGDGMRAYVRWQNHLCSSEDMHNLVFVESPLVHPAVMARTAAVREAGGYRDGAFPEDYELWLRLVCCGHRLGKVNEKLFCWSDPPARLTRTCGRYSRMAFTRLKAHYLRRLHPAAEAGVCICGAGREGRALATALVQENYRLLCFYDVSKKRSGRTVRGVPVFEARALADGAPGLLLVAVPGAEKRAELAAFLGGLGFLPSTGFIFMC